MAPYHKLDISGFYNSLILSAVNTTISRYLNVDTPFDKKVYSIPFINLDQLMDLNARIKTTEKEIDLSREEFNLIYCCHYIATAFTNDKEAFFKWFINQEEVYK